MSRIRIVRILAHLPAAALGMSGYGGRWTRERLDRFLENPRAAVPGTTMEFEGIGDAAERRAIVDYLEGLGD
jgi:cytochrome c